MPRTEFQRSSVWLIALACFFSAWPADARALTATPTEATTTPAPCPTCSGPLGYLYVGSPSVDPPMPVVGDLVTFTLPVSYNGPDQIRCDSGDCIFEAGGSLLDGDEISVYNQDTVVVRRRVARGGVVTVQLRVYARTENRCYSPLPTPQVGCQDYYPPTFIEATSPPFRLEAADAPTPTATPTPTRTTTQPATPTLSPTCFGPTPSVYPVLSPTGVLIQTIRGSVHPVLCERLFGIDGVEVITQRVDCIHGFFEATIRLHADATNEFYVCQRGECASIRCATVRIVHDSALAATTCTGDCSSDGTLTVDEVVTGVNIALGLQSLEVCPSFDTNGDGRVDIGELIGAVNHALDGCPSPAVTPTPMATHPEPRRYAEPALGNRGAEGRARFKRKSFDGSR